MEPGLWLLLGLPGHSRQSWGGRGQLLGNPARARSLLATDASCCELLHVGRENFVSSVGHCSTLLTGSTASSLRVWGGAGYHLASPRQVSLELGHFLELAMREATSEPHSLLLITSIQEQPLPGPNKTA